MKKEPKGLKRLLFMLGSIVVFVVGLILIIYDLYKMIYLKENITSNFILGFTLIYESIRLSGWQLSGKFS